MKKVLTKYSIFFILLIAVILRLWKLGSIPPHLTPDEAALGYNAYSILKTGRDEYGETLPIIFKSFGDYKPGLYIYSDVPLVALFGLNEFSVRLPSAIAGVLAIWLVYKIILLVKNSPTSKGRNTKLSTNYQLLAITASFFLAVSPWHIHFSRGAWEVNLSLTLTLVGILFFLKSFKNLNYLLLSSLFFALTLLTYQGAKLSTAIVVFILVTVYWKRVRGWIRNRPFTVAGSLLLGLIISLPIIFSLFAGKTGRLSVFSVFSYPRPEQYLRSFLDQGGEKIGSLTYYLYHPEWLNFKRGVLGRYYNHFSGKFLFFEGDYQNPRHSAPYQGMLLLVDLVLLPLGLVEIVGKRDKFGKFVILWLLLAPLPAVFSRDQVQAVRAFNMVIPFVLVSSSGLLFIVKLVESVKAKTVQLFGFGILVLLLFSSLIYYFDAYFIHLPKHDSEYWGYGYKQIVQSIIPIQQNYKEIKIQQSFAQPYIYFLFYQLYDPAKYQRQSVLSESEYRGDVGYVEKLDNIRFVPIDWSVYKNDHGDLIIGDPIQIPEKDSIDISKYILIKEIKYLDNETAFKLIEII